MEPASESDQRGDEPVATAQTAVADESVEEELLVEEISIDGMCGVY
ncbi:MAG: mycofactocin precursor MftA [Acidimicrobiia bacterium]|nr:mycofactocin precursor MftA [Acidimicrobiia bacterium]